MAQRQWRALYKAIGHLGDEPSDEALHGVRIQAKRLRYLAEMASPVVGSADRPGPPPGPLRPRPTCRTSSVSSTMRL